MYILGVLGENIKFVMPFTNLYNLSRKLNINDFPDELLLEIFEKLDYEDLCRCSGVCHRWYELAHSMSLRKKIVIGRYLKPIQVAQLVQHHFHQQLQEFHFLNYNSSLICVMKKMTFYRLRDMCPQLKTLILMGCCIKYVSLEDMPESLCHLSLRGSELNPYNFFKGSPGQYTPHLTCLDLGGVVTFLTSEDLHVFNRLKSLRCLYLEHCFRINDGGIESMIDLIGHLEVLDVEGTDISNDGAQIIIRNGAVLKNLYMGFTSINDFVFDGRYMNMFLKLQHFCIRFTNISSDTIKTLRKNKGIKIDCTTDDEHFLTKPGKACHLRNCNHYLSHSCS